ncbi:hypothetical protein D3C87_1756180 [compost metagenome]
MIDIENHQRHVAFLLLRLAEHDVEMAIEIAPVVEAGEFVGNRQSHGIVDAFAQLHGIAMPAYLRAHPR